MKQPTQLFKDNICHLARKYAGCSPAKTAAIKAYECLADEQYKTCCEHFPSYEQDCSNAAVAAFTRWIRKDRRK